MRHVTILLLLFAILGANAQVLQLSDVDSAPVFAKGKMASADFLRLYLTYPQDEYNEGIEGNVILKYTVTAEGEIKNISFQQRLSPALDKEAIRVALLFPFYTPAQKDGKPVAVKIQFTIPFSLKSNKVAENKAPKIITNKSNEPKNPLYVIDDKVIQDNVNINPDEIKKIRIVKGQKAVDLYGNRAKDGIIMIETK
jgi:TonB family protein